MPEWESEAEKSVMSVSLAYLLVKKTSSTKV